LALDHLTKALWLSSFSRAGIASERAGPPDSNIGSLGPCSECPESAFAEACRLFDVADRHQNRLKSIIAKLNAIPKPPLAGSHSPTHCLKPGQAVTEREKDRDNDETDLASSSWQCGRFCNPQEATWPPSYCPGGSYATLRPRFTHCKHRSL